MASARSERKAAFLGRMSNCIASSQPKLEEGFGIELGEVTARELTVWKWTRDQMKFGKEVWLLNREIRKGRPPRWWERWLIEVQSWIIPIILFVPVWLRFWAPELLMKWDGRDRCILIPFHGWDRTYFEENSKKIDQWVVHELAHATWEALGGDHETGGDGSTWRMWDEGFAHYIADEWFRERYPPETQLTGDWSDFRKEGKRKVAALVAEKGDGVLGEIPSRWREFEAGMKFSVDPIIESASDLKKLAARLADDGTDFLKSSLGSIPLLSSIRPRVEEADFGADEQHYFLVPFRPAPEDYALYTVRVLPDGIGPENDLPKRRIFHLPASGSEVALEALLSRQLSDEARARLGDDSPLADRLETLADDIDRSSNLVTGGLLLIGGAVAFANPVAGAVIAAKAIIPSLGSKVSTGAFEYVSDKLRKFQGDRSTAKARKEAEQQIKRLKPELLTNPLLALLEEAVSTTDVSFDPVFDSRNTPVDLEEARLCSLAAEAIWSCYQPVLRTNAIIDEARLHPADVAWIRSLEAQMAERNHG